MWHARCFFSVKILKGRELLKTLFGTHFWTQILYFGDPKPSFWRPEGSILASLGSIWAPFGALRRHWGPFGTLAWKSVRFGHKTRPRGSPFWSPFLSLGYQSLRQNSVLFWSLFQDVILEGPGEHFGRKMWPYRLPLGSVCFIYKKLMCCEGPHFCRK